MDVKSVFLNRFLEKRVYVKNNLLVLRLMEDKVYWLKKTLYSLKRALEFGTIEWMHIWIIVDLTQVETSTRIWYNRMDAYLINNEFITGPSKPTLYIPKVNEEDKILIKIAMKT